MYGVLKSWSDQLTCKLRHQKAMCVEDTSWLAAADVITPDDVFDVLEEDVRDADMILWVGISFQQSASTAYFRRVRSFLQVCFYPHRTGCLSQHQ